MLIYHAIQKIIQLRARGGGGCCMEDFVFWIIYGISTSARWSVRGAGVEKC